MHIHFAIQFIETEIFRFFSTDIFVPLQFWFQSNSNLAIPLIAIQHNHMPLNIEY